MRNYNCYIYTKNGKDLERNSNTACFAGIKFYAPETTVYISQFRQPETEQYIDLIVTIINKITPCQIIKINNEEYIEFKLLNTYDQSLILLNFIRNLWNKISKDFYEKNEKKFYNIEFFEILKNYKKYREPLKRLTYANKKACEIFKLGYTGHSNVFEHSTLKIKTTKELLNFKGLYIKNFLQK